MQIPSWFTHALVSPYVFALLIGIGSSPVLAKPPIAGHVRVVDGDTLKFDGQRVRLYGIDAPETTQTCQDAAGRAWPCGADAGAALTHFIDGRPVTCVQLGTDPYRRAIAKCSVAGIDVGTWLVEQGWALAFLRYSHDYVDAQSQAAQAHRGMHRGTFIAPWDYRRSHR